MSRKRNVPFLSGRMEIWAAAIIHARGSINFLFDPNFEPYIGAADISDYFSTSKSTVSQKAKVIRDMFKMGYWDNEFSTIHMQKSNPVSNLVMVDEMIVDMRSLPLDIQEILRQKKGPQKVKMYWGRCHVLDFMGLTTHNSQLTKLTKPKPLS